EMSAAFLEIFPGNAPQGPIKILAVDDEPDVRSLLEQYFQEQIDSGRYQFMFANDGQSALKVLEEHPEVHVALTDLNMPGMNGLTLLAEFERVAPALRAVVLSAYGDLPNIRQAMNRGAFDFLVKPIDLGDLEITLEKAATVARQMSRAFHSLEENRTLKSFIDPALLRHILPIMRSASGGLGECAEATIAVIGFPDLAKRLRQAVDEALGVGRMDVLQQTHQHLNASFDTALALLAAHDGSAVRFDGGYLIASFRGPEQLERAVRACVQIRDTLPIHQATTGGVHLGSVSSGIASGTTVSGIIGAPSRQRFDHALIGGAVATAHSLFMAASPGEILLPEQLAEKLRVHFPCLPDARVQPSPSVPTACVALKPGWLPDHRASTGHEPTVNL
ncbi:MAG TPA: response regulator, partial [Polyangiaceae bacterium]|nr:response regulator [Polyangiaceae bacterium]